MSDGKSRSPSNLRKRPHPDHASGMDSPTDSTTCSDFGDYGSSESKVAKRERNRQIAKNNRDRKREAARELQETVNFLKRKNQALQNELNMKPSFLVKDRHLSVAFDTDFTATVMGVLDQLRSHTGSESTAFYVVNASSHFFPIICASCAFSELTGYPLHEIVGQNCGFLSGPQTSRNERERLNTALQSGQDISSTLLSYRKDGSTFWNSIHLVNVSTMQPTGELAPYLIIGLHAEVISIQGNLVDCSGPEGHAFEDWRGGAGSSADSAPSSGPSSGNPGPSGLSSWNSGSSSSGSSGGHNASGGAEDSLRRSNSAEFPASDDDEHTILQEIISAHQEVLSRTQSAASGEYHSQVPGPDLTPSAAHPPRSESVMSVLTTNTDGGDHPGSSPTSAQLLAGMSALTAHMLPSSSSASYPATPTKTAAGTITAVFSTPLYRRPPTSTFQSLSPIFAGTGVVFTPSTPVTRAPRRGSGSFTESSFPAIEGLSGSALRGLDRLDSQAGSSSSAVREVPPYPYLSSCDGTPVARRSPPNTTALRRTYFSALEGTSAMKFDADCEPRNNTPVVQDSPTVNLPPSSPQRFNPSVQTGSAFYSLRRDPAAREEAASPTVVIASGTNSANTTGESSPRGANKKVSFTSATSGTESPISSFELLYSHKHAPVGLAAAVAAAGRAGVDQSICDMTEEHDSGAAAEASSMDRDCDSKCIAYKSGPALSRDNSTGAASGAPGAPGASRAGTRGGAGGKAGLRQSTPRFPYHG